MTQHHIPEEELNEALDLYRAAIEDALNGFDVDADRNKIIAEARRILGDDDPDALELIVEVDQSEGGDPVWQLEEELIEDRLDSDFPAEEEDEEEFDADGDGSRAATSDTEV